jgi:pimeloyl-ACP methyl ester carboxylesterase
VASLKFDAECGIKIMLMGLFYFWFTLEAPLYAIRHPDKVAKLVLWGVTYDYRESMDERKRSAADEEARKVMYSYPSSIKRWAGMGTKEEFVVPGAFEAYRKAHLASDPKSGDLGVMLALGPGLAVEGALLAW